MPRARPRYALLLRGVNVGGHKRVPMADLRQLLEGLGYDRVRTLLNSGNAVFDTARAMPATRLAAVIDSAIEARFGFTARAFVLTASDVDLVVAENTLGVKGEAFRASLIPCGGQWFTRSDKAVYCIGAK